MLYLTRIPNSSRATSRFSHFNFFKEGIEFIKHSGLISLDIIQKIWASTRETLSLVFANNKGADHLISAFVIRLIESIISKLATSQFSVF